MPKYLIILSLFLLTYLSVDGQIQIDSTIILSDTATINGEFYTGFSKRDYSLYVLNSKDSVVFQGDGFYYQFEFVDFDKDGNKDIIIYHLSNVPGVQDLILYDPTSHSFVPIVGFNHYPDAKPIVDSKYFYSYHRSGCADKNWDSDLFFIDNFKIIKVGNIAGRECEDRDEKDGIYIYKIAGEVKTLFKTLPITTIQNYKDYKWGFILEFWTKNYKEFDNSN